MCFRLSSHSILWDNIYLILIFINIIYWFVFTSLLNLNCSIAHIIWSQWINLVWNHCCIAKKFFYIWNIWFPAFRRIAQSFLFSKAFILSKRLGIQFLISNLIFRISLFNVLSINLNLRFGRIIWILFSLICLQISRNIHILLI